MQETTGGTRELIKAGSHVVRLVQIVDLWTQKFEYQGQEKEARKIFLTFEFPNNTYEYEDKQGIKKSGVKVKGNEFTLSRSEKANLRKFIEVWLWTQTLSEDGLDVWAWLGKVWLWVIQHTTSTKGKVYDNLEAVMPLVDWMQEPKAITHTSYFDLDNYDAKLFDSLPEWLQDKIRLSPEYSAVAWNKPTETISPSDSSEVEMPF